MVFAPFSGLKTGIDFAYFGLNSGIVFEGIRGEHEGICPLDSKRIRKREEYRNSKLWILTRAHQIDHGAPDFQKSQVVRV